MMNGAIRAAARATKMIVSIVRAGLKIVYVDTNWRYDPHKCYKHIDTMHHQETIYWPGSEKDDGVMDRREAKERDFNVFNGYGRKADYRDVVVVNSLTEEEEEDDEVDVDDDVANLIMIYKHYFDPSLIAWSYIYLRKEWEYRWLYESKCLNQLMKFLQAVQNRGYELARTAKSELDSGISL
ncbi:hypothetical protein ACJIZ3_025397 [Penstemon smallii]|uniref:Uncharacterized protein n=1 Tax=Penstemon smallii TaxID=265156 RepID=A0ABD3TVV1_9LAMI